MRQFVSKLTSETAHDRAGKPAAEAAFVQVAEGVLGEGNLVHPSAHDRLSHGLPALQPNPVRSPRDEAGRQAFAVSDLPGELHEAERAGRNVVEVESGDQLERGHP